MTSELHVSEEDKLCKILQILLERREQWQGEPLRSFSVSVQTQVDSFARSVTSHAF